MFTHFNDYLTYVLFTFFKKPYCYDIYTNLLQAWHTFRIRMLELILIKQRYVKELNISSVLINIFVIFFLVGETGLEPIRTMYTSPHCMHNLAVCNHYQQVTVFCITGASTNFATPRLYSVKELLQRYKIKMIYASIIGV